LQRKYFRIAGGDDKAVQIERRHRRKALRPVVGDEARPVMAQDLAADEVSLVNVGGVWSIG
jgi:hypothetical protein